MSYVNNNILNNCVATTSVATDKQTNKELVQPFNGHSLIKTIDIPTSINNNGIIKKNFNIKGKANLKSSDYYSQTRHKVTIINSENNKLRCTNTGCFFSISETEYELEKTQANNIIDGPDDYIAQYPCPYLADKFKGQASRHLLEQENLDKITSLIHNSMLQQGMKFRSNTIFSEKEDNLYLYFTAINSGTGNAVPNLRYNITWYTQNYIKAPAAITELWKEVEADKCIVKLNILYPNMFDKESKVHVDTWSFNDNKTSCIIIKSNDTKYEFPMNNFIDINKFSINFDQLQDGLTKLGVPYKKLFLPAQKTLKSKFLTPKVDIPSGILYTNMFTIF